MNFEQVWAVTSKIGGFFEKEEAELYWSVLHRTPGPVVVEVGLENGRSTSIPAQYSKFVYPLTIHCVDNFSTFGDKGQRQFEDNMMEIQALYILWKRPSHLMAGMFTDVSSILIDADHDDSEVDCQTWIPQLASGGWMLFHDYGREPWNIKEVVDRYCDGWYGETAGTLAARQKP